jgi:hypothetical protein
MRGIATFAEREKEVASIHSKGASMATAPITIMKKMMICCKRLKLRCELNKPRKVPIGRTGEILSEDEAMVTLLIGWKIHVAGTSGN